MKTAKRIGSTAIVVFAAWLAAGTLQAAVVVMGSVPTFGLVAQSGDQWSASNPLTWNVNWTNQPVTALLLDEEGMSDPTQSGTISVQTSLAGPYTNPISYSTSSSINAGKLYSLSPAATYGVQIVANGTTPPMSRGIWRVGNADYLLRSPGTNIALPATPIGSAGSTGAANLIDQSLTAGARWRADPAAAENYCGITFALPQFVGALRVTTGVSNGPTFAWNNYRVEALNPGTGLWDNLGQATQANTLPYWVDLGGMIVGGVRLYGSTALGNNPTAGGGLIIDEIQVFLPEPASLALLAVGTLPLLRRRRAV